MVLFSGDFGGNDSSCSFRSVICKCHFPPIFTDAFTFVTVKKQESEERDTLEVANEKDKKAAKKKLNAKRKDKDGGRSQEFMGRSKKKKP